MEKIRLAEISCRAPEGFHKEETKEQTEVMLKRLNKLQNLLYAESKHSVLVIFQGMDASGKDGVIRNVFGTLNPQGVMVQSFKVPTEKELAHDFLWRIHQYTPAKGAIQIFNRSHYEDIIVTRVHKWCDDELAKKRMKAINDFEQLLEEHNNTHILKFYLHVSKEEQQSRLQERIDNPEKQWKYNKRDFTEASLRDEYTRMYEECFDKCNDVPWVVVPADQNWYKEYLVAKTLLDKLESLNMKFPEINP
jgi:PPK2 family polyphosphate:nucleotide phosphotransferase